MHKHFLSKLILISVGFSVLTLSSVFLFSSKHNNKLNSYSVVKNNSNLFSNNSVNVNVTNEQITNLIYDATPQDNKLFISTNKYVFDINPLVDQQITNENFNKFIFADLSSKIQTAKKTYIDQLQFDKNNNMFFDYKYSDNSLITTNNLFVKHLNNNDDSSKKTNSLNQIKLPKNVNSIYSYKIAKNGSDIAIETADKKLYVGKISWSNNYSQEKTIWASLNTDETFAKIKNYSYDFDSYNNLYLLDSTEMHKYLLTNRNSSDFSNNIPPISDNNLSDNLLFSGSDVKNYGMQININKNNNVLLSINAKWKNNKKYSKYFYQTQLSTFDSQSSIENTSLFKLLNTDYTNVNSNTASPFFNFKQVNYGINNSIALINSFSSTTNPNGLYFSPTGIPIKQISDSKGIDRKGTFSFYDQKDITNNNSIKAAAVNTFNLKLNKIAVASNNQVLSGLYSTNTHLNPGAFDTKNPSKPIKFSGLALTGILIAGIIVVGFILTIFFMALICLVNRLSNAFGGMNPQEIENYMNGIPDILEQENDQGDEHVLQDILDTPPNELTPQEQYEADDAAVASFRDMSRYEQENIYLRVSPALRGEINGEELSANEQHMLRFFRSPLARRITNDLYEWTANDNSLNAENIDNYASPNEIAYNTPRNFRYGEDLLTPPEEQLPDTENVNVNPNDSINSNIMEEQAVMDNGVVIDGNLEGWIPEGLDPVVTNFFANVAIDAENVTNDAVQNAVENLGEDVFINITESIEDIFI